MESENEKPGFMGVVDSVMHLFGEVMSRDAVYAVVEHYNGDLNQSIDALMNMCDENNPAGDQIDISSSSTDQRNQLTQINNAGAACQNTTQNMNTSSCVGMAKPSISYSGVSQAKELVPKQSTKPTPTNKSAHNIWTYQTKQIVGYHHQGSRTLILMRGLPGSGKSYLAKQLLQAVCPDAVCKTHILSTDDFFIIKGTYRYDRSRLSEAHYWNQNRARETMRRGLSPIFIDNTNVEMWEMEPYVKDGLNNGYIIEVLEPNTPWAKRANQLAQKNSHNVPIANIRRMLDNYQNGITATYLIRSCGLSYSPDKKPPVKRNIPPILATANTPLLNQSTSASSDQTIALLPKSSTSEVKPSSNATQLNQLKPISSDQSHALLAHSSDIEETIETAFVQDQPESKKNHAVPGSTTSENVTLPSEDKTNPSIGEDTKKNPDDIKVITIQELRKQLEEIEKIDQEWDQGESWHESSEATTSSQAKDKPLVVTEGVPLRRRGSVETDNFLPSSSNYNDWTKISMFMPAWNDYQHKNQQVLSSVKVETASHGTSVEFGDTDPKNKNLKILIGKPKDINFYYMGLNVEKIPEKRMLDKSSMTNDHDHITTETVRCKSEEKHFAALRKLFKNISKIELRDIFDKCLGDVNWAVDIVFDGMKNKQLQTIDSDDYSDSEETNDEQCECLAAYNIIPNKNTHPPTKSERNDQIVSLTAGPSKIKKDKTVLESSIQLKRQIEQNVVIPDSHYSEHCLRIRKIRRGEINDSRGDSIQEEVEEIATESPASTVPMFTETILSDETDEEDSQASSDDCERTVNVDLGTVFVSELDAMFGRSDMVYPENITNRINMPISLLNEINALWVESLMYQLDQQSRDSELMLRQDEEFARQLAQKEEQLAQAGLEPTVPDLKEIMDMELALSIYKKEITAEWRNNEPNDLAARMTREKLYNLFPDVLPEILSELLMAHDNNFQATVEVLLSSTGNAQILEEQNGVSKFIARKELERQKKTLEEQKKALSEVEWPVLSKEVKVDMSTVQDYRVKASQFLAKRNMYYLKAQEFFSRDMMDVAAYYSDVAVMHKKMFEHANSLAAASLMQVHAEKSEDNATIDFHFLHVPEAKETLDLFIDSHIQKLRDTHLGGPKFHTLFFITGRGLHSQGGPKIKPAVKRRLRERGIAFAERNPGLLTSKVCAEDKMTHQLP